MSKVLIVGRFPPPVGGITVHVSRLVKSLAASKFENFSFCDTGKGNWWDTACKILTNRTIHLHISNPFLQFLFALACFLARKKLLLTYHGNWGRYGMFGNLAVKLSARLCTFPIVQNLASYKQAQRYNQNAQLISTYIACNEVIPLKSDIHEKLSEFRQRFRFVFCTNAWNLTFDKNGQETYGISQIVSHISHDKSAGLVISDPSRTYKPFIESMFGVIAQNILFIECAHDFRNVLLFSDAFIRNTTTDGVSLSIFEARACNVVVLASDCVERADFCVLYNDISKVNLIKAVEKGRELLKNAVKDAEADVVGQLIALYNNANV